VARLTDLRRMADLGKVSLAAVETEHDVAAERMAEIHAAMLVRNAAVFLMSSKLL
jgi:hypothetical protein